MNTADDIKLFIIVMYISLSTVFGLFTILRSNKEANPYVQVVLWAIAPALLLIGALIVKPAKKAKYFNSIAKKLLIKL